MNNIKFIKTDDGTTGLYSESVQDIFHSKFGALTEAKEKFCEPVMNCEFYKKEKIKILDICYGIGYNTKAALSLFNNKLIEISALEYDNNFVLLSPFIKDGLSDNKLKIDLLSDIFASGIQPSQIIEFLDSFSASDTENFFEAAIIDFIRYLMYKGYECDTAGNKQALLHNIYYCYISNNMKNGSITSYSKNFIFDYFTGDARKNLSRLNDKFDVVFLDAFSSQKDPTLWTIDFLSRVKDLMTADSLLVSYSKSTPFRSALLKLGFYVGKTIIYGKDFGTVASFNSDNIKTPLDKFDTGLISTRSGIPYKDPCLNLKPDIILKNRLEEMNASNLISQTQFLKQYKKDY